MPLEDVPPNSFMSDCQIRLALDGDLSPSGYRDTARIASGSNPVHYLPVWNLRRGGPGDPGAVICGRHDWVVGGGCKRRPTTNRQRRFGLRLLSLQWGGGGGWSKRGDETKQFRNSWFTSMLWFPVRNRRKHRGRSCCTYTSPGLARGARRMRSYVIWLATGPPA